MSQDFKFNFKGGEEKSQSNENNNSHYSQPGNVRNLCFEWPDGRKKFLNYAYLISGEYNYEDQTINLIFSTESILISGSNLGPIFESIFQHMPKILKCTSDRYSSLSTEESVINSINTESCK